MEASREACQGVFEISSREQGNPEARVKIARISVFLSSMLSAIFFTASAHSLSPDPKVLALIPHDAQVLSGVSASGPERRKLLIFTEENAVDLDDFMAIAATDDSKFIRQIFFIAGRQGAESRVEHSLLAIGHFDHARIYRSALEIGARAQIYRGMEILALRRFPRDRRPADNPLWMAIVGSELALFGTVPHVREELDRYLDRVPPDPTLLQDFARFRSKDEMWCLLPDLKQYPDVRRDLGLLDRRFLDAANDGMRSLFGIHFGRRIQLDYEFARPVQGNATGANDEPNHRASAFVSNSDQRADSGSLAGTISISTSQYEKWIARLQR